MQPRKLRSFQNSVAFLTLYLIYNCYQTVEAQRPLFNHTTFNSLPTLNNNYLSGGVGNGVGIGGGHQLRNGRQPDIPMPKPTTRNGIIFQQGIQLYQNTDHDIPTRLPPFTSRRENQRRLNLAGLGGGQQPFPEKSNGRRGIESLRKELMKPSVGGPGGGISGHNVGYPSYSSSSSIGKIDGLGSLGSADRYGEHTYQNPIGLPISMANGQYSTRFPPSYSASADNKIRIINGKKQSNSIAELKKMQNNRNKLFPKDQPDSTAIDDDIIKSEDPIRDLQEEIKKSSPNLDLYIPVSQSIPDSEIEDQLGVKCTFDKPCAWKWSEGLPDGFQIMSGMELAKQNLTGLLPGPITDSVDDANGKFLYARLLPTTLQVNLTSPQFSTTMEKCYLEVFMHQSDMSHGLSRVVVEPLHTAESSWVPTEIAGDNFRQWDRKSFRLGRISRDFRIVFEIVPTLTKGHKAHVAIDNLRMVNCFPEGTKSEKCSISQIKCMMNHVPVCIPLPRICDITKDCDAGEDEALNCDKVPYGGRCSFEEDWCGWRDSGRAALSWSRHTGSSPTHDTGPDGDHTYQHILNSTGGYYMLVNMNQHMNDSEKMAKTGFASNAIMVSRTFNPPPLVHGNPNSPYRNSCVVRFYIHQFGKNPGSINLSVVEMKEKENMTTTLWWSSKNQGSEWLRAEYVLPNITAKYYLQFEARMGMRIFSDVAVDDFSLSPECFGLNIPKEHLNGYNYYDVRTSVKSPPHRDFEQKHYLELTTCDTRGMIGPSQVQCETSYKHRNKTNMLRDVRVIEDQSSFKGMQKWKVPHEGFYTIIAKGASGGLGSGGVGSSRGALSVAVLELHKNEELYVLVGQQGENACIKSMGSAKEEGCGDHQSLDLSKFTFNLKQHLVKNIDIENGAGGGGGGSYVFLLNSAKNEAVPLVVAGGGGGLGIGRYLDEDFQHGRQPNATRLGVSGQIHGEINRKSAGPGGGWRAKADQALGPKYGAALLQGGRGGHSCFADHLNNDTSSKRHGQGGFGGGGGGCYTGGGGGGFAGGDVYMGESNGEGGTSYITPSRSLKDFSTVYPGGSSGAGSVIIIPAIEGCGCDYRCVALDEHRSVIRCICPDGWRLKRDNSTACELFDEVSSTDLYYILFISLVVTLIGSLCCLCNMLYTRHKQRREKTMRQKMLEEQDMQLSRLRHNIDATNLNNFNPNYGCDGILNGHIDVNSLPQVARESLRLIKPLGQGAFGEVYQGLYRHRDGDAVEMPVAVKTLPEMSTRQAEEDFLMEAAIMSKFNHPNMVHLIGVCFDRHPRFIVLELLAGGDLKNFLREGRHKPERPSTLTMKDLVFCALDVAKGCRYMESKRFIHRDIAARNCLLSSKGPGRVVKIADFGMARDIYRSDYYRKGGKAMLPIKWMPPEAFLDGIFTSKTDVWSFGVLLWEVFSLGLMPYTGLPNPEVMQLVTNGGRLGCPTGCPAIVYKMMVDCWNPNPEERPTFSILLERITALTQDPEVMNAPLPSILRQPASERDQGLMRTPGGGDEFCLPMPNTSDYLIPLPNIRNGGEYASTAGSINRANTAIATTSTACSPPAVNSPSAPNALNINEEEQHGSWETSFILPNSKSDQPLLEAHGNESLHSTTNTPGGSQCGSAQRSPIVNNKVTSATNTVPMNGSIMTNGSVTNLRQDFSPNPPEAKLISLDTPQPTPTTIQPPLSFANQLEGITLDPAALAKSLQQNGSAAAAQSYANIQMMTSVGATGAGGTGPNNICSETIPEKPMNGNVPSLQHNGTNTGLPNGNASAFTIQGYADRFKDNHSEISC